MIVIKEEFLSHEKLVRAVDEAGYEALAVWMAIKAHVTINLTDGFISKDDLVTLRFPRPIAPRKLQKCIQALTRCGKRTRDGELGPGLIVETEGGYEMHDYLDHANSREQVELQREKARLKKAEQRKKVREELEQTRERRMLIDRTVPEGHTQGTRAGTERGTRHGTQVGTHTGTSRVGAPAPANPTQPNPTQEDPKAAEADPRPPGQSDELSPERQQRPPGNLEAALRVPVMQRAQLLIENPHTLTFVEPHNWPEVRWLGDHVADATGWHKLRWTQPSKAVMRLVALLAEFSGAELQTFVKAMNGEEWFRDKGFTALSDEVVRRTLGKAGGASTTEDENRRRAEERAAREEEGRQSARAAFLTSKGAA